MPETRFTGYSKLSPEEKKRFDAWLLKKYGEGLDTLALFIQPDTLIKVWRNETTRPEGEVSIGPITEQELATAKTRAGITPTEAAPGVGDEVIGNEQEWLDKINEVRKKLGIPLKTDVSPITDMFQEYFELWNVQREIESEQKAEQKAEQMARSQQQRQWGEEVNRAALARSQAERWMTPEQRQTLADYEVNLKSGLFARTAPWLQGGEMPPPEVAQSINQQISQRAAEMQQQAMGQQFAGQQAIESEDWRRSAANTEAGIGVRETPFTPSSFAQSGLTPVSRERGALGQRMAQSEEFENWRNRLLSQLDGPANEVSRWFVQHKQNPFQVQTERLMASGTPEDEGFVDMEAERAEAEWRAGPAAPAWMTQAGFLPEVGRRLPADKGLGRVETPSGQQLTRLDPSQSQFLAGAIDWFGGTSWQDRLSRAATMQPRTPRGATSARRWTPLRV